MPLTAGQILQERYRIEQILGQGGMGAVYRALDLRLNRACAVKENLDTALDAREQFAREARFLVLLGKHPSLVQVYDFFVEPDGVQYLVMELIEGEDLATLVARQGPLSEAQAIEWMSQILDAVEYLHSQNPPIIHRDIKPQNIRITPQGKAVLVDFGIAKEYKPGKATVTGARAETPGFAPPEQYSGGTNERSDVYALGATLYFVLTGVVPPDAAQRAAGVILKSPRQINTAISPSIETAIMVAMNLSITQRFDSVGAFKHALLKERKKVPLLSTREILPSRTIKQRREKSHLEVWVGGFLAELEKRKALMIAALVSLLIVIVGLLYSCAGSFQPGRMPTSEPFTPKESINATNVHRLTTLRNPNKMGKILGTTWLPAYEGPFVVTEKAVLLYMPGTDESIPVADIPFLTTASTQIQYLPSLNLMAELKNDRSSSIWTVATDGKINHILFLNEVGALAVDLNTLSVGLGFDDGVIAIISSGGHVDYIGTETKKISAISFTPKGNAIVYSGDDRKIRSRVIGEPSESSLLGEMECIVRDIEFSTDGNWAAAAGDCPQIQVWNLQKKGESKPPLGTPFPFGSIASIAFAPGVRVNLLASAGTDGYLRIWNVADESKLFDVDSRQRPLKKVLFSPDGRWLVSVGQNNTIKFWAVK